MNRDTEEGRARGKEKKRGSERKNRTGTWTWVDRFSCRARSEAEGGPSELPSLDMGVLFFFFFSVPGNPSDPGKTSTVPLPGIVWLAGGTLCDRATLSRREKLRELQPGRLAGRQQVTRAWNKVWSGFRVSFGKAEGGQPLMVHCICVFSLVSRASTMYACPGSMWPGYYVLQKDPSSSSSRGVCFFFFSFSSASLPCMHVPQKRIFGNAVWCVCVCV